MTSTRLGTLAERPYDALIQSFDAVLLLLANLGLGLHDVPELEDVLLDLLHVRRRDNGIAAGHLLHISLELADVLAHNLLVHDVSLLRHLGMRSGRERN